MALASVALVSALAVSIFTVDHLKTKWAAAQQYESSAANNSNEKEPQLASARALNEPNGVDNKLLETGKFSQWNEKKNSLRELRRQLRLLNSTEGMDVTMSGLVARKDDPLIRIVGRMTIARLFLARDVESEQDKIKIERENNLLLEDNNTLIQSLERAQDQLYAYLALGDIYTDLNNTVEVQDAYDMAKIVSAKLNVSRDPVEKIVTETIIAEHFYQLGQSVEGAQHYEVAIESVNEIDSNTLEAIWAVPFIIRSQARVEQYSSAYSLLEQVENSAIKERLMDDLTNFAASDTFVSDAFGADKAKILEPSSADLSEIEKEFAGDPDMLQLFENQRIMQENARRLTELGKKFK